jgi:hypothetical protein
MKDKKLSLKINPFKAYVFKFLGSIPNDYKGKYLKRNKSHFS